MAKKSPKFSVTVALRAVVNVPVSASSLEEAQNVEIDLEDVADFKGKDVHDFRLKVIGSSDDNGWDILDD